MHPEAERRREANERERASISVCEGTLSSSPQNPWRGLPCQSISRSLLQSHPVGRHRHTYTQTWLGSPHCESSAISSFYTQSDTDAHARPIGMMARKWQAAAGGSLHSSTESAAPQRHPLPYPNTFYTHVLLRRCVLGCAKICM